MRNWLKMYGYTSKRGWTMTLMDMFLPWLVVKRIRNECYDKERRIDRLGVIINRLTKHLRKTHTKNEILAIGWNGKEPENA